MARPVPIAHTDTDPLLAFASESAEKTTAAARAPLREVAAPSTAAQTSERQQTAKSKPSGFKGRPVTPTLAIAVVAVSLLGSIGLAVYNGYRPAFLAERPASDAAGVATLSSVEGPPPGTVAIASNREGVDVFIDDRLVGHTPLRLSLPAGTHALKVQNGTETRSLPLTVTSGETLSQYIELAPVPTPRVAGELEVTSNPPGADVRVDGSLKGRTPLTVRALTIGSHTIVIGTGNTAVKRTVYLAPGAAASIVASSLDPAATGGWVAFKTPVELEIFEAGRLVGTTAVDRLMLPSGEHRLELVGDPWEFRTSVSVRIVGGETRSAAVDVPNGSLSVNALPWAEVAIDGRAVGTTPLANIVLPIGTHEVVWKHPQYGERRQTVPVKAKTPVRIGVDFRP